ncbi:MAG: ATP-binding protein [Cyanobacteria bacterium P01_F01_bin.150]
MVSINPRILFQACNPVKTLNYRNAVDRQYYIDFSDVRSIELVSELAQSIEWADAPTCQLFTGHIGCGKSTELLRLKATLEDQGFHVVYFESSEMLDMADVDVSDILLAIAHQVSTNLKKEAKISLRTGYFKNLMQECANFLHTPIEIKPEMEVDLWGIGKLTAEAKASPTLRSKLRQYLEPQTKSLLTGINEEILQPAIATLQKRGKQGLVIILDNLDRIDDRTLDSGKTLQEYLFVSRGEQLGKLECHMVYTIPLALMFSNEQMALKNRLGRGSNPFVLPMVPVRDRDGRSHAEGIQQLRQLVLSRAFPTWSPDDRELAVGQLFASSGLLDRLCQMSGGHVRNLLGFMVSCIRKSKTFPINEESVNRTLQEAKDDLVGTITADEWELLRKVAQTKSVAGEGEHKILLRSLFVFEYRTEEGRWFDVNPLLADYVS